MLTESGAVVVEFDISSLQQVVDDYVARGGELREVLNRAEPILVTAIEDVFESEGSGEWKQSRRAEEQGGKTLQDTGILAGSINAESGEDWIVAGSNVPYGKYHLPPEKSGHPVTTGVMPVRDWLAIDEAATLDEIADLMTRHIVGD